MCSLLNTNLEPDTNGIAHNEIPAPKHDLLLFKLIFHGQSLYQHALLGDIVQVTKLIKDTLGSERENQSWKTLKCKLGRKISIPS